MFKFLPKISLGILLTVLILTKKNKKTCNIAENFENIIFLCGTISILYANHILLL